jgi:hypothetical protein
LIINIAFPITLHLLLLVGTFLRGKAHGNAKKTFSQGDVYTGNYFMDRYVQDVQDVQYVQTFILFVPSYKFLVMI